MYYADDFDADEIFNMFFGWVWGGQNKCGMYFRNLHV